MNPTAAAVTADPSSSGNPFVRPDYDGRGIVNLMASLEHALGAGAHPARAPVCPSLPDALLRDARHVVLLVVDGLGARQLHAHAPDGALAAARLADLTSVFPSTTASAVTTFLTGDAPLAHGLTGWHMWFREVGQVASPLPFKLRGARTDLEALGFDAPGLLGTHPFAARLGRRVDVLHPAYLCDTAFTRAHTRGATVHPFTGLEQMGAALARLARQREPSYCYAYWPDLDSLSHARGWASREAGDHLRRVDAVVERCARELQGTGTVMLVTADHGFVDTTPESRLRLEDHPGIARTLDRPLCGEPRMAYCHVREGLGPEFEHAVHEQLGHAVECATVEQLLSAGLLGPGPAHPEIRHRLGTHALMARDRYCLTDTLPGEEPFSLVGVHGGMSDDELRVPLCVFPGEV